MEKEKEIRTSLDMRTARPGLTVVRTPLTAKNGTKSIHHAARQMIDGKPYIIDKISDEGIYLTDKEGLSIGPVAPSQLIEASYGKTLADLNKLQKQWKEDPCWDLWNTEGFEHWEDYLRDFQKACETVSDQQYEEAIRKDMEKLGLWYPVQKGLYNRLKHMEDLIDKLFIAEEERKNV